MKKLSTRRALLFAAATVVCALGVPSIASASSWGVIGSEHTLDSPNLTFSLASGIVAACGESSFTTDVRSPTALAITTASFARCTVTGGPIQHCTQTSVATGLPWTVTGTSTTNIQIHGVRIDVQFINPPGSFLCNVNGATGTITGTLIGGRWTGNGTGQHEIVFSDAQGLVSHSASLGNDVPVTTTGTLRDTQQTLFLLP